MSEKTKLKPGQKFPTPTPGNGDRVFYETLLSQRPDSEMAQEWCLAYGVMDDGDAKKAYKSMVKRKEMGKSARGASKSPPPAKSGGGTSGKKKKKTKGKKILDDVEYDAGMTAGGDEGIGIAAM
mmetsp:Transcript_14608/g.35212  ORF Transcript_14608/g.35212 Transcript_14608/m.35212 type:complete len:124 (+) Transcript_14608:167-538(+)